MIQHRTDRYQCLEEMPKGINEIYEVYCGMSDSPVPKKKFKEILLSFNESIMEHIINGGEFNMGFNLSMLSVLRAKVNPRLAKIDWKTSNELKKDLEEKGIPLYDKETGKGEKWFVYHTTKDYVKFYWAKGQCKVKNSIVYRFDPAGGKNSPKAKLKSLIKNDDLAYLRFKRYGNL